MIGIVDNRTQREQVRRGLQQVFSVLKSSILKPNTIELGKLKLETVIRIFDLQYNDEGSFVLERDIEDFRDLQVPESLGTQDSA